jgi:hypothetical protein
MSSVLAFLPSLMMPACGSRTKFWTPSENQWYPRHPVFGVHALLHDCPVAALVKQYDMMI